jgi:hypothetical protein
MFGVAEVLAGMFILRGIAATDMSAFQAHPKVDPRVAAFDALFAEVLVRVGDADLIEMYALNRHCLTSHTQFALLRFHGVVDGLRHDPPIFDNERVGAVAHTRMLGFGRPLQECHASLY